MPGKGQINPSKKVIAPCLECGEPFASWKTQPLKYCSKACYATAMAKRRQTVQCPGCGSAFTCHLSWPRKFCSRKCSGIANVRNIQSFTPTGYDTNCEQCGSSFRATKATRGRFCSLRCYGAWTSIHIRGQSHPKHGQTQPPRQLKRVTVTCRNCGNSFLDTPVHGERRITCSRACLGQYVSKTGRNAGQNSPVWRGGHQPTYGPSWRKSQRLARERDKTCRRCGKPPTPGRALDVHHIVPFRTFGVERHSEANVLANLVALCRRCHSLTEWEIVRGHISDFLPVALPA